MVRLSTASLLAGAALVYGQTFTSCNPLTNTSCPDDAGFSSPMTYEWDFTTLTSLPDEWEMTSGNATFNSSGACLTVHKEGDAPTMQTTKFFFFGRIETHVRASWGTGIVSSMVVESDVLDEIDWEMLGGSPSSTQSNYFGKGNTTTFDRGQLHDVDGGIFETHNYTIGWSEQAIQWYIDGALVRTVTYESAVSGTNFPQTPSNFRIGIWAGGAAPDPGTVAWAGGKTPFNQAPFTMMVQKVVLVNANPACSYHYSDETGDFSSITKKISGCSNTAGDSTTGGSADSGSTDSGSTDSGSTASSSSSSSSSSSTSSSNTASDSTVSSPGSRTSVPVSGNNSLNSTASSSGSNSRTSESPSTSSTAVPGLAVVADVNSWALMAAAGIAGFFMTL